MKVGQVLCRPALEVALAWGGQGCWSRSVAFHLLRSRSYTMSTRRLWRWSPDLGHEASGNAGAVHKWNLYSLDVYMVLSGHWSRRFAELRFCAPLVSVVAHSFVNGERVNRPGFSGGSIA